ncbi:hypothetical protein [Flavobacterium sp. XGLA_31]|uniref:hypothetical protein n=1 Tax=Flavobacterium sp. XGLA_31 TaxID=3447666 RepID=UPI003F2DD751
MNAKSLTYLSKIWLVTIFVTPFIYWPINSYINDNSFINFSEFGPVLFASVVGASVLSLPTFVIIFIVFRKMIKEDIPKNRIKYTIAFIGFLGVLTSCMILDFSIFSNLKSIFFPLCYVLCLCISAMFFKINPDLEKNNFD